MVKHFVCSKLDITQHDYSLGYDILGGYRWTKAQFCLIQQLKTFKYLRLRGVWGQKICAYDWWSKNYA